MNSREVAMAGRGGTYGCDATRKKRGGETAAQGAMCGSGEFSPTLLVSPAQQDREGEVAPAAMV